MTVQEVDVEGFDFKYTITSEGDFYFKGCTVNGMWKKPLRKVRRKHRIVRLVFVQSVKKRFIKSL